MARAKAAPRPEERRSTEFAHSLIRERIISGEIPAGSTVSQAALAASIGVSRTPLREAVRQLQSEGLLVGEPNQRLRVAEISPEDLDQLYAIRIGTESTALRAGVPLMEQGLTDRLGKCIAEMESLALAGEIASIDQPHREFHRLLIEPAGDRFALLADTLWDHTTRYRAVYLRLHGEPVEVLLAAHRDHQAILDAVRARDGVAAALALAAHYERTAFAVFEAIAPEFEPVLMPQAMLDLRAAG